ncbi:MAG: thiol peroxidase [Flavobacteriales bacterium]|nr:thiol peroxidase [Flavobacteriales bacterium]
MATIISRGNDVETTGNLPIVGSKAPNFRLTGQDLRDFSLEDFKGKRIVLNIFPSIDTSTCASSVRKFNELAASMENTEVICVSKDLPFACKRFCGAEGISNVITGSQYKDNSFSEGYQVDMISGTALSGLMSRAVVVVDADGIVEYTEQVGDISDEPNYLV